MVSCSPPAYCELVICGVLGDTRGRYFIPLYPLPDLYRALYEFLLTHVLSRPSHHVPHQNDHLKVLQQVTSNVDRC